MRKKKVTARILRMTTSIVVLLKQPNLPMNQLFFLCLFLFDWVHVKGSLRTSHLHFWAEHWKKRFVIKFWVIFQLWWNVSLWSPKWFKHKFISIGQVSNSQGKFEEHNEEPRIYFRLTVWKLLRYIKSWRTHNRTTVNASKLMSFDQIAHKSFKSIKIIGTTFNCQCVREH